MYRARPTLCTVHDRQPTDRGAKWMHDRLIPFNAGSIKAPLIRPNERASVAGLPLTCGAPPIFGARHCLRGTPGLARRRLCMVSLWWVIAAFFGGGFAGVLVMALMYMAG